MNPTSNTLRFILNDEDVAISDIGATETLLDYLRLTRRLRGSKEGCAEGDCGACTVLVGRLGADGLSYKTINACIAFVGSLHGTHVVTIEHLSPAGGPLHPVQQAMVDFHGSQCGFCTPGIVMSLYGLWMEDPKPSVDGIEKALQGNLCRCTGYAPIVRHFPELAEVWDRIGGAQVRNAGTLGANIANGTPPPFIALGAHIVLRRGSERREVKLRDFFIGYGKQDRQPGEFVESIKIPYLPDGEKLACYKITKRKDEDISALCGAFRVFVNDLGKVGMIRIAFGGMAATPKRALAVEEALLGKPWTTETIEASLPAFATDYQPISDMRASKEYRMLAAQNLLRRFHLETTGAVERLSREVA